jgi:hypothetical protein
LTRSRHLQEDRGITWGKTVVKRRMGRCRFHLQFAQGRGGERGERSTPARRSAEGREINAGNAGYRRRFPPMCCFVDDNEADIELTEIMLSAKRTSCAATFAWLPRMPTRRLMYCDRDPRSTTRWI